MANTQSPFQNFSTEITLSTSKNNSLKKSRNALRSDIKTWFSDKEKKLPSFCWQGSFSMKTVVNPPSNGEYDLDDGVYLYGYENIKKEDWPSPTTVHSWIKDAVKDRTKADPIDKDTCVRVCYSGIVKKSAV